MGSERNINRAKIGPKHRAELEACERHGIAPGRRSIIMHKADTERGPVNVYEVRAEFCGETLVVAELDRHGDARMLTAAAHLFEMARYLVEKFYDWELEQVPVDLREFVRLARSAIWTADEAILTPCPCCHGQHDHRKGD